jgi:hypothetical protein
MFLTFGSFNSLSKSHWNRCVFQGSVLNPVAQEMRVDFSPQLNETTGYTLFQGSIFRPIAVQCYFIWIASAHRVAAEGRRPVVLTVSGED